MRCDLEELPSSAVFASEVCIVGGGIAGLVLARKLANSGVDVHLLEAGGPRLEDRSQQLYQGRLLGAAHRAMTDGRFRTFGGSSTRWAGQLLPYPDEVFAPRPAVQDVGWPLTPGELTPYYPEIRTLMGVNDLPFDEHFLNELGVPLPAHHEAVRLRFSKWAPPSKRNLAWTAGRDCLVSDRATVFFHANAIACQFTPDGGDVTDVTVKNYQGTVFKFVAKWFVLCAGTIETCRLLLNSERTNAARFARAHDQVGRYFFDHVSAAVAGISKATYNSYKQHLAPYYRKKTLHTARLETSAEFQTKERILAVMAHFEFEEPEGSGLVLARRFMHDVLQGRLGQKGCQKWSDLPKAITGALHTLYDLKVRGRRFPTPQAQISLRFDTEQRPHAESRISLSNDVDMLGVPKLLLDWKRAADELWAMYRFAGPVDTFVRSWGIELEWKPGLLENFDAWKEMGGDICHPMGGARMGISPAESVVDANLRLHGTGNCFVASCAVYPTGGSSNPTFTLMALTLRLADHLKSQIRN